MMANTDVSDTASFGVVSRLTFKGIRGNVRKRLDGSIPHIIIRIAGKDIKEIRPYTKLDTKNPTFKFRLQPSLAEYVSNANDIQFLVDGNVLPIEYVNIPERNDPKPIDDLIEKLSNGFFISKKGELLRSLKIDNEWQDGVFSFYEYARKKFKRLFGYDLHIIYGTLLGLEREGDFIEGDDDFDTAYFSKHSNPDLVKAEFIEIVSKLSASGENISLTKRRNLIKWKKNGVNIDIFFSWIEGPNYYLTFAVGGPFADLFIDGFEEVEFKTRSVLAPVRRRELLEAIYGPKWQTPDPLFQWKIQPEALRMMKHVKVTDLDLAKTHWANFYKNQEAPQQPSDFARFVMSRMPTKIRRIVDFGCGNGRDTQFIANGRIALGVDYSENAVNYNRAKGQANITYKKVNAGSRKSLQKNLSKFISSEPTIFYSRFVIHAISDKAEATLLRFLKKILKPGSVLYLEFRTNEDSNTQKTFGEHFRRYLDPDAFMNRVRKGGQFKIVFDKRGHGMAVYKDEDPHVCRLIIRRRGIFSRYVYRAFEKLSMRLGLDR